MFKKITLKNGLRILVVPQKSTQAVTVLVLVGTGSKYEQRELNGISHFLEHMFFKGTKKRPDKVELAEVLDKVGGAYNAFTGQEYTGYWAKVKAEYFELALDWVSDIFLHSLLPQKEIEKERGVILQEINMRYDDPMSYVQELWQKVLYGDQPAGWPIAGTKESIGNVQRQYLLQYMRSQYKASNTVVCIAGNIKVSEAIKKTKHYFAPIAEGEFQKKPAVGEQQWEPQVLLHERKTDQTHLCLGVRGYNLFHPMKYAYEILGVLLGGMMSSRLFVEVRERLGIAYYIRTSIELDTDTGYLVTAAGVEHQSVKKAIQTILREYKKMAMKKIAPAELRKAKDYLKGTSALMLEPSDAKASFYGMQELLERRILTPEEIYKKIDKVNASQVQAVARGLFRKNRLNLALVGPYKEEKEFQELMKL